MADDNEHRNDESVPLLQRGNAPNVQPPEQEPPKSRWRHLKKCLGIILIVVLLFALLAALGLSGYSTYKVLQIHTTYEKIGSRHCLNVTGTSRMFTGLTVGFATETGATEYKCVLTGDDIQIQYYNDIRLSVYTDEKEVNFLNVTKYRTFLSDKSNRDVACSKCSVSGRGVIDMVPGRIDCIDDTWTKEYDGYLMTDEGSTTFRCVDSDMDAPLDTDHQGNNNPILRHVVLTNTITDHFKSNKVLSCVVCSK